MSRTLHRISITIARHKRGWCELCEATVSLDSGHCRGPIKKPLAHRLLEIDRKSGRVVCSWCGPADLVASRASNGACINATRSNRINGAGHGLTQGEVRSMLFRAICWICGSPAQHVDHCHTSGKVRGTLCRFCNLGLGHFKDNPELLSRAATYLKENG